jgi:hypothetical protein
VAATVSEERLPGVALSHLNSDAPNSQLAAAAAASSGSKKHGEWHFPNLLKVISSLWKETERDVGVRART